MTTPPSTDWRLLNLGTYNKRWISRGCSLYLGAIVVLFEHSTCVTCVRVYSYVNMVYNLECSVLLSIFGIQRNMVSYLILVQYAMIHHDMSPSLEAYVHTSLPRPCPHDRYSWRRKRHEPRGGADGIYLAFDYMCLRDF